MPQYFLDYFWMLIRLQKPCRTGMTKAVKVGPRDTGMNFAPDGRSCGINLISCFIDILHSLPSLILDTIAATQLTHVQFTIDSQ